MRQFWRLLPGLLILHSLVGAQTAMVRRDPQAIAIAVKALEALTAGTSIQSVRLSASASYRAGSDRELGPAILEANGISNSRMELDLNDGPRIWTRNDAANFPSGQWSGPDGKPHAMSANNCWTDAAWFFPALTVLDDLSDPRVGVVYRGVTSLAGVQAIALQFFRVPSGGTAASTQLIQNLSSETLYLNAASFLPMEMDFNVHPDNSDTGIPVRVSFSRYEMQNGAVIPFHIEEFLQGVRFLDLSVTEVSLNPTLSGSDFNQP